MRYSSLWLDKASQREDKEISRLRGSSVGCDVASQREEKEISRIEVAQWVRCS
jgi:hypothetical protein